MPRPRIRKSKTSTLLAVLRKILQLLKLPDGTVRVLVEGGVRAQVVKFTNHADYFEAETVAVASKGKASKETKVLMRSVFDQFTKYVKLNKKISEDIVTAVSDTKDSAKLVDTIAVHLNVKIDEKQKLLSEIDVAKRLESLFSLMEGEISVLKVEKENPVVVSNVKWKKPSANIILMSK